MSVAFGPPPPLPTPRIPRKFLVINCLLTELSPLPEEARVFLPFYTRTNFNVTTYYIAPQVPGASNSNNGLYPNYMGGMQNESE